MQKEVRSILIEDGRRHERIEARFDPLTGEGSVGERVRVVIPDHVVPVQWVPVEMMDVALVRMCVEAGSIREMVRRLYGEGEGRPADVSAGTGQAGAEQGPAGDAAGTGARGDAAGTGDGLTEEQMAVEVQKVRERLVRVRVKYDFAFWAAFLVKIKKKGGGDDVNFVLNRPQRKLVGVLEQYRKAGMPIRIVLLKARQWGGSTCIQMYMAWLQLVHEVGLNSLIVGHVGAVSSEVEDMFKKMLNAYPTEMLHEVGEKYDEKESKWTGVGSVQNIHRVPARNCKIKTGSAETPDSARGGDYNLVHCTEVGLWKKTEGKTPEEIMQGATDGILLRAMTMIVLESTAKGVGNFFHREYMAAKNGISQFMAVFVAWWEIDQYSLEFKDRETKERFAEWLWKNRNNNTAEDDRHESGEYLYWLWELGATLEAIHWYINERMGKNSSGRMRSEFPSDDIEAFVNSGANVFDKVLVERFRKACKPARWTGEVVGLVPLGGQGMTAGTNMTMRGIGCKELLQNIHFVEDSSGHLKIWSKPEEDDDDEMIRNRYLVSVDVGGRGEAADYSVIVVLDRLGMLCGEKPTVVAEWYGHIDMDLLAWKAAQIAKYYNDALLVIESNTLETRDRDRIVDGDQTQFILLQIKEAYDNLYARKQSEEQIKEGAPVKYGFHTNTATKPMVISTLISVVREMAYVERDHGTLDEFCFYERKQNGAYGAIIGKHDDKLMARAIGLFVCFYDMEMPKVVKRTRSGVSRLKRVERGEG